MKGLEMKFLSLEKVAQGKYLNYYYLYYENKIGNKKRFEIVSKHEIEKESQIGEKVDGVVIVATMGEKLLLLKEFRMGVNSIVYNLPAGMLEEGETVTACATRELYEETGLRIKKIKLILPPSYGAVDITDAKSIVVMAEVEGELSESTAENEEIIPVLLTKEEVRTLVMTEKFSARAQMVAIFMSMFDENKNCNIKKNEV